jgi:phospholipase/lecithinase/hemolysin
MPAIRFRIARCVVLTAIAVFVYAGPAAATITNVFVFGDSLADAGNNAIVFDTVIAPPGTPPGTLRTATPIPSQSFIPTFPYAANRYSNGAVWVEQLAAQLGFGAQPSLLGGTNYAFGGARSGPSPSSFPFSLLDQTAMFLGATGGVASSSALYVVAGGGNDARDAFSLAALGGDPTALIAAYADNIGEILMRLDAAGAEKFLLANVPDIGQTPAVQALGAQAAALASGIAAAMNAALAAELALLPADVVDGLMLLDAYALLNGVFLDPGAYGLGDATSACAASPACIADPSKTFFWDGIHPTTAGHRVIADAALKLIPEPGVLLLLAAALVLLPFARRLGRDAAVTARPRVQPPSASRAGSPRRSSA